MTTPPLSQSYVSAGKPQEPLRQGDSHLDLGVPKGCSGRRFLVLKGDK